MDNFKPTSTRPTGALKLGFPVIAPIGPVPGDLISPIKGVSLSQLLAGVNGLVARAYQEGVWTIVEVMELNVSNRHVYLGLSERDVNGAVLAKVRGVIWGSVAYNILPVFEKATGVQLAPGLKLMVRARPVFKELHGFSLEIDAIDDQFTLGDFEVRKKEIRQRLREEGIFTQNKELPRPWDFNTVIVVAPPNAAGLGDFQAEAERLANLKICHFEYCYSRFQGEGAGAEIRQNLIEALKSWKARFGTPPDAIAIIRGGGAANDLAWLDDFHLTRLICRMPIPVLTGIGHERDSTLLDEVASASFDTPSKVIAGIERVILKRCQDASEEFKAFTDLTAKVLLETQVKSIQLEAQVRAQAQRHLSDAHRLSLGLQVEVQRLARQRLSHAQSVSNTAISEIRASSVQAVATAKLKAPALLDEVLLRASNDARQAGRAAGNLMSALQSQVGQQVESARSKTNSVFDSFTTGAQAALNLGRAKSEAYMREIAGLGPDKTLKRGFAIVMTDGKPVSRASHIKPGTPYQIQFSDGALPAQFNTEK